ncbi:hypothetical protein BGZ59_009171, partial [Podila verticillata]
CGKPSICKMESSVKVVRHKGKEILFMEKVDEVLVLEVDRAEAVEHLKDTDEDFERWFLSKSYIKMENNSDGSHKTIEIIDKA